MPWFVHLYVCSQCYVALDYQKEWDASAASADYEKQYTLPDGNVVTLSNERFRHTEAFFQPSMLYTHNDELVAKLAACEGLHTAVRASIEACADEKTRVQCYGNIVLVR